MAVECVVIKCLSVKDVDLKSRVCTSEVRGRRPSNGTVYSSRECVCEF